MKNVKITYGIIGDPVAHSLSPAMHNAAFEALGVEATYELFPVASEDLEEFFIQLKEKDSPVFGLNVTVPHKEKVLPFLDKYSPLVQRINAVNTIVITEERKLIGYNTDAPGFISHLAELEFNTAGKNIAIIGAGGSARAILGTLCMIPERPQSISIYNRTTSRLDNLLSDLRTRIDLSNVKVTESIDNLDIEYADLLINTTSVGLDGNDPCLVSQELLRENLLVYDLVYKPRETPLMKMAQQVGARAVNGLGMLYYQGVLSLQHWANIELDERVKHIMREKLEDAAGV